MRTFLEIHTTKQNFFQKPDLRTILTNSSSLPNISQDKVPEFANHRVRIQISYPCSIESIRGILLDPPLSIHQRMIFFVESLVYTEGNAGCYNYTRHYHNGILVTVILSLPVVLYFLMHFVRSIGSRISTCWHFAATKNHQFSNSVKTRAFWKSQEMQPPNPHKQIAQLLNTQLIKIIETSKKYTVKLTGPWTIRFQKNHIKPEFCKTKNTNHPSVLCCKPKANRLFQFCKGQEARRHQKPEPWSYHKTLKINPDITAVTKCTGKEPKRTQKLRQTKPCTQKKNHEKRPNKERNQKQNPCKRNCQADLYCFIFLTSNKIITTTRKKETGWPQKCCRNPQRALNPAQNPLCYKPSLLCSEKWSSQKLMMQCSQKNILPVQNFSADKVLTIAHENRNQTREESSQTTATTTNNLVACLQRRKREEQTTRL